ncbi:FecCD family ABC transporter permease [Cellulomonas phragmiteti]|uniref:FecCD family ABC transporter permease n=1 Tax=Cellulomonas phragmiteti TaxID=478780 RepID=UPI001EF18D10|nr:iron ABC transporter permease [Cellulomonas phragmiteti]
MTLSTSPPHVNASSTSGPSRTPTADDATAAPARPTRGRRRTPTRGAVVLVVLAAALVAGCVAAVGIGPLVVPPRAVLDVVLAHVAGGPGPADPMHDTVVWLLRLPRVLVGACVGAVLAASGAALQAVVRNQLADPYLLGVSAGASLGAALVLTLGLGALVGTVTLTGGAFAGALLALLLVIGVLGARTGLSSHRLVLAGLTVGYFLTAVTNLVVVLADSRDAVRAVMFWMLGSLGRSSWGDLPLLAAATAVTLGVLVLRARRLDAISLGDDVARSLGTDPDRLRRQVAVVAALGVAAAVAVSGAIGFVGLVVPHLARRLVGATHRLVVPASALLGALVLVVADTLARTVLAPREIPLGVLTALLGTPLLMALVRRRLRRSAD